MPESAFSVVSVSNSPESSAAVAVTTFIVEPGGVDALRGPVDQRGGRVGRELAERLRVLDHVGVEAGDRGHDLHGSRLGVERDHRAADARGDRRGELVDREPLGLGVESERDVGALRRDVAELVDDRGELVLLSGEEVVLGELDPGAAHLDERVADRVAERAGSSAG